MNLKYKIALTMLIALNLKLYPMQENVNNNINNNNYCNLYNIPNKIWRYILNKVKRLYPMQKDINNNNNINNNNYFNLYNISNAIWEDTLNKINLANQTEIQNLLSQNIELKKDFNRNEENIIRNENEIQDLLKDSKNNLLGICLFNILDMVLTNKKYKEFIYPIIKTNFLNKLNQEQLCELLSILIKSEDKNFKTLAKIILDQDNIDLNNLNIPYYDYQLPIFIYAAIYNDKSTIEFLIENGANLNKQDRSGKTALMMPSCIGYTEIVKLLIENGANLNKQDHSGKTALMMASWNGHIEIVKFLIANGADLNKQDRVWRKTALMWASERGHIEIVKLLIENDAKLDIQDKYDKTALMYASENNHIEIVKLLENSANNNNQQTSSYCTIL